MKDFGKGKRKLLLGVLSSFPWINFPFIFLELFYKSVNCAKLIKMQMILPIDMLIISSGDATGYCAVDIDQPCI